MAKVWRWLLAGAAVLGALILAYFAGNERPKEAQQAAVDAAHADDAVKAAEAQAQAAHNKAVQLAVQSAAASKDYDAKREALPNADTAEIDKLLIAAGILKP